MEPDDVRVMSQFVGGAFGSGLRPQYQVVLAALAALALKRSVRLVLTRQQMYGLGYRPAMIQQISLGASADGILEAITHEAITVTSQYEDYFRQETGWSGLLYKSANAKYTHKLARLDLPTSCDMRAPSAAPGVYALESAMDELAVALKLDPLDLRLRCYSDRDQHTDRPYSSKSLRDCYRQGAEAFGWDKRSPEPRSMRDGHELVGWGMATGVWEALQVPITVRIVLTANGHAEVSCATSDIGTGSYTIMAQVAAEMLGLPLESVTIRLGDSTLPQSPVEGGSWIAASVSNGIVTTSEAIREQLLRLAKQMPNSPLADATVGEVLLVDGNLVSKRDASQAVSIAEAMRHGGVDRITEEKSTNFADDGSRAHNTHSAIFAEVKVDDQLGVIRVTRVVSGRGWPHPEHQDREKSDPGRRGVGHRHGAARGDADRPQVRPHHECEHRRISCSGPCRRARHRGHLRRRTGRHDQWTRYQGAGRNRYRRCCRSDRQRGLSRNRQARARPAHHA
jgi:xanthine dehydrogenase YagR molybdenum-binding subunit